MTPDAQDCYVPPIMRLPNELLSLILEHAQPEVWNLGENPDSSSPHYDGLEGWADEDRHSRLTASLVCRRFCDIVATTPRLWTNLTVLSHCDDTTKRRVQLQLDRSAGCLLSVRCHLSKMTKSYEIPMLLNPHLPRCLQLVMVYDNVEADDIRASLPPAFPNLIHLAIYRFAYTTFKMSALSVPKLQVLETRLPFLIPLAEPYPTLRSLSLHHTTLSPLDLFEFLRNSRFTLQNLSLCVVTFDDTNPPSTWIPVVMEALQSLLCRTMRRMSFPRLFHGIEAPRLKQLSVISSNWNPETDLDIPDTWSCPDLEILLWCYTPAEGLRRILAKAPNLHTLHLDWMATDILTEVTNRPQGPVYCPRLANLGCRGIQINDILEIALARRFHSLQTITILQPHINHPANDEQSSEWRNCTQIIREMPEIKLSIDLRGSLLCRHMFQWNLPPDSNLYFPWWLEYDPNPVAEPNQVGIE